MSLNNLRFYFRTISYLRVKQILYRAWYAVRPRCPGFLLPKAESLPNSLEWLRLRPIVPFLSYPWFEASMTAQGHFRFLNDSAEYRNNIDWHCSAKGRLWRYNLHYFQYLHTKEKLSSKVSIPLIVNWIDRNPPGCPDAWDPFPTSLRIVNWIKYLSQMKIEALSDFESETICRSIYQQALWLVRSIELHLMGNHLFKNLKALIFAGLFFKSNDAERWLSKGIGMLHQELDEQILSDGGHFERSPMYHCMILEDCLDLLNVCKCNPLPKVQSLSTHLERIIPKMVLYLRGMTHPDGEIALFNDAAFGIEVSPSHLVAYYEQLTGKQASSPEFSVWSFPATGYFVMEPRRGDRLLIDCGPIGPDYQPGHGHCDTLSFELSIMGNRVIVDSGCYTYENSEIRSYNRGNVGHNTLTLNGENQSEIWSAFRCAGRAYPLNTKFWQDAKGLYFEGSHNGYRRLPGKPIHLRQFKWKGTQLLIDDQVIGRGIYNYELRLHVNPALKVEIREEEAWIECEDEVVINVKPIGIGKLDIVKGWYCPEFGKSLSCPVLTLKGLEENTFNTGWIISY